GRGLETRAQLKTFILFHLRVSWFPCSAWELTSGAPALRVCSASRNRPHVLTSKALPQLKNEDDNQQYQPRSGDQGMGRACGSGHGWRLRTWLCHFEATLCHPAGSKATQMPSARLPLCRFEASHRWSGSAQEKTNKNKMQNHN